MSIFNVSVTQTMGETESRRSNLTDKSINTDFVISVEHRVQEGLAHAVIVTTDGRNLVEKQFNPNFDQVMKLLNVKGY